MENNFINNMLEDLENILDSPIKMSEANEVINIYEGNYIIKVKDDEIQVKGRIEFGWIPSTGAIFYGEIISSTDIFLIRTVNEFEVIINGYNIGIGLISNFNIQHGLCTVKGIFQFETIVGDKSIAVEKIKFCIPNFKDFIGTSVKKISSSGSYSGKNRLKFENSKFTIIIDKCINYKDLYSSLELKGGYIITYTGEIIPKKGNINFDQTKEILNCFNTFLSFINGKRTSAIFIHGIYEEKTIWCDYSNYHVDLYDFAPSWTNSHHTEGYNELWQEFCLIWEKDKDVLDMSIHWYLECNKNSGFTEGSLIMAQTALELLYNWSVVEKKKLIIGKDAESISASNKIRLLVSHFGLDYTIPKKFTSLQSYLKSESLIDAADAVVQIRNAIVHSQEEKRKKLNNIDGRAKYQALQLCIWYIEFSLLKALNYKGQYINRCLVR